MITYNGAKQLLDQGIFPCLIYNGEINYIISYNDNELSCTSFYGASYTAENENSELSSQFISDGGGGMVE